MAISFPGSKSNGQKFTAGNKSWTWDGNSWKGGVSSGSDAGTLDSLNSTQFLRSDATDGTTGSLGVGTTSPAEKLEVNGSVKVGNLKIQNEYGGRIGFNRNTANGAIYDSSYAAFQINGATSTLDYLSFEAYPVSGSPSNAMSIKSNGNVGFGATNPTAKLQVEGTFSVRTSSNQSFNDSNNANNLTMTDSKAHFNIDGADKDFQVSSDTVTHSLFVQGSDGNVGIGVTNPATPLQIYQSTNATAGDQKPTPVLTLSAHTNSDNEGPAIEFNSAWVNSSSYLATTINNGWGVAKIAGVYDDDQGNGGALSFYTNEGPSATSGATSSQLTEKMRIKPNGNVGIGTTIPSEKLHVEGSIRASGNIGVTQTDGDYLAKLYQTSADGFLELYTGEATPVSRVKLSSYGDSYIAPSTNSRLGIGTTSPAGRLHVLGSGGVSSTIQLESTGTGNTVFYMKGAAGSDFWGMFTGSTGGGLTLKDETNNKDAFIARPQAKLAYPSQTRFSAFSTSGSTSYSALSPFVLNYTRNNINGRYNQVNGIFTADVDGLYQFRFNAYAYNSGQWTVLYWNGSSVVAYLDSDGTTSAGDHTVLVTVGANQIHHMAWTMHLTSGKGAAVGWRSGYSGSIYRSHAQFSGELISAD